MDGHLVANLSEGVLKKSVTDFLDETSVFCGVDIFLLGPKLTPVVGALDGDDELRRDQRWRVAIYGDYLSSEHAKTRVLIHIDQLVCSLSRILLESEQTILMLNIAGENCRCRKVRVFSAPSLVWAEP